LFTRAALSTSGRAKNQIPISFWTTAGDGGIDVLGNLLAERGRFVRLIPVKTEGFFSNPFFGRQSFGQPPWL
jgi:hypothetical protein